MRAPDCHPGRRHVGRGLCNACYARTRYHGRLADYDRQVRTRDEFLDEYVILRRQGLTTQQMAERLGLTHGAVNTAVRRARNAGDPRVVRS